jgi:hypothetical protein
MLNERIPNQIHLFAPFHWLRANPMAAAVTKGFPHFESAALQLKHAKLILSGTEKNCGALMMQTPGIKRKIRQTRRLLNRKLPTSKAIIRPSLSFNSWIFIGAPDEVNHHTSALKSTVKKTAKTGPVGLGFETWSWKFP